jgi:hypothetical protein
VIEIEPLGIGEIHAMFGKVAPPLRFVPSDHDLA